MNKNLVDGTALLPGDDGFVGRIGFIFSAPQKIWGLESQRTLFQRVSAILVADVLMLMLNMWWWGAPRNQRFLLDYGFSLGDDNPLGDEEKARPTDPTLHDPTLRASLVSAEPSLGGFSEMVRSVRSVLVPSSKARSPERSVFASSKASSP